MSSFRSHRIVIASLFLPDTAALGDASEAPTPGFVLQQPPGFGLLNHSTAATPAPKTPGWRPFPTAPLPSIVDDLANQVRARESDCAHTC